MFVYFVVGGIKKYRPKKKEIMVFLTSVRYFLCVFNHPFWWFFFVVATDSRKHYNLSTSVDMMWKKKKKLNEKGWATIAEREVKGWQNDAGEKYDAYVTRPLI